MAAKVGCVQVNLGGQHYSMHPFFKPVLSKQDALHLQKQTNGQGVPSSPAAYVPISYQDAGSSANVYQSTDEHVISDPSSLPQQSSIGEDSENLDIDLNLDRRKRRKTTPFEDTDTVDQSPGRTQAATNADGSWFEQLQEAANDVSVETPMYEERESAPIPGSPPTSSIGSPLKMAIRPSPTKTPRKPEVVADAPVATPATTSRPSTRSTSSIGKEILSPTYASTPKKKILKLSSKGKLLSSPPPVSPASKRKAKTRSARNTVNTSTVAKMATRVSYGTDEDSRKRIGKQIDQILSQRPDGDDRPKPAPETFKVTHPFFSGKLAKTTKIDVIIVDDSSMSGHEPDADEIRTIKPKDWKDLGFTKTKTSTMKVVDSIHPLWPPRGMLHLSASNSLPVSQRGIPILGTLRGSSKSKQKLCTVSDDEDVLHRYAQNLERPRGYRHDAFPLPQKTILTAQEVIDVVRDDLAAAADSSQGMTALQNAFPKAFKRLRRNVLTGLSLIDANIPGTASSWLSGFAPTRTSEVLQGQSKILHEWLASHQVQSTVTKLSAPKVKTARKRRRKKKTDELDDFIASSDDEDESGSVTTKNAILIQGPHGCGKTASVYAVAKELGFEVFEIHPGMRRSAKDIFDKVGDMTQNHLVQKTSQLDQASDPTSDIDVPHLLGSDNAMRSFLRGKQQKTAKYTVQSLPSSPQIDTQKSQGQKQSLILFEEVDILFEEDRGFWTGVIQLIEQSKRPVVLTCNDATSVPVQDLPLHTTLSYSQIGLDVAVDYMIMLAAAEGHLLKREAVRCLYVVKSKDLRASISELDFWCQTGVGSQKAGLDWIIDRKYHEAHPRDDGEALKLVSKDTYSTGMGFVPRRLLDEESSANGSLLQYARNELSIPLQHWHFHGHEYGVPLMLAGSESFGSSLEILQQYRELADTRSALDVLTNFDDDSDEVSHAHRPTICAGLDTSYFSALLPNKRLISASDITTAYLKSKARASGLTQDTIFTALEPLMEEKPQFPVSMGRLAPSLDTSSTSIVTDTLPYVRSIVLYEQRLEEQREALGGGSENTTTRKTRAARAAIEGGSKAQTRVEKWFPKDTDYAAVVQTGGSWPSWMNETDSKHFDGSHDGNESRTESEAASPVADTEMSNGT